MIFVHKYEDNTFIHYKITANYNVKGNDILTFAILRKSRAINYKLQKI
jgi:hypothetical protein